MGIDLDRLEINNTHEMNLHRLLNVENGDWLDVSPDGELIEISTFGDKVVFWFKNLFSGGGRQIIVNETCNAIFQEMIDKAKQTKKEINLPPIMFYCFSQSNTMKDSTAKLQQIKQKIEEITTSLINKELVNQITPQMFYLLQNGINGRNQVFDYFERNTPNFDPAKHHRKFLERTLDVVRERLHLDGSETLTPERRAELERELDGDQE